MITKYRFAGEIIVFSCPNQVLYILEQKVLWSFNTCVDSADSHAHEISVVRQGLNIGSLMFWLDFNWFSNFIFFLARLCFCRDLLENVILFFYLEVLGNVSHKWFGVPLVEIFLAVDVCIECFVIVH